MSHLFNISVIIPTYNRNDIVQRAIDSVLNQTYKPVEIFVIDDGSTDNTKSALKEKYINIKYYWQENAGISRARNFGIEKSAGDWIAFLDSDDEWLPQKLEMQVSAIHNSPDYRICHTNEIWIRNGKRVNPKKIHQKYGGQIFDKCLPLCVISPSSVLIKKDVFEEFGIFDTALPACEDYDLWLRLTPFLPVLYVNTPLLIKYGGHQDQLSKKYWGMDRFRIAALEKVITNPKIDSQLKSEALHTLITKLKIFINGAQKRQKRSPDLDSFREKLEFYQTIKTNL